MPYSEDDFETSKMQEPQVSMSKAELRKSHKPLMEKRRRARINTCLNEIKNLILEAMNKDPARHSKLEKADILEMAVKHLQNVQRQQLAIAVATDPSVLRKFKSGFNECATEIDKFIDRSESADAALRQRVNSHLQKCINGLEQVAQFTLPTIGGLPLVNNANVYTSNRNQLDSDRLGDQNNNPSIQIPQGIQLIPSRLPTGELALLVPNSSNMPYFPTSSIQQRPSAFVTVVPKSTEATTKSYSPPVSPVIEPRAQSPKGFRPIYEAPCNLPKPKPAYPGEDHQVPQITSTVATTEEKTHKFVAPLEVKNIKYPIHKHLEKRDHGVRKPSEPLCVITNHGERYKQAQPREDSAHYEENYLPPKGIKRAFEEVQPSPGHLNTTVPEAPFGRPTKVIKYNTFEIPSASSTLTSLALSRSENLHYNKDQIKTEKSSMESFVSFSNVAYERQTTPKDESSSKSSNPQNVPAEHNSDSNDMWRPW